MKNIVTISCLFVFFCSMAFSQGEKEFIKKLIIRNQVSESVAVDISTTKGRNSVSISPEEKIMVFSIFTMNPNSREFDVGGNSFSLSHSGQDRLGFDSALSFYVDIVDVDDRITLATTIGSDELVSTEGAVDYFGYLVSEFESFIYIREMSSVKLEITVIP